MALNRKIAYVNLSTGDVRQSPIPPSLRSRFLGGRAMNAYLLYNHARPGTDPLESDNVLVVGAGLLTGCPAPAAAFAVVSSKSPLTNLAGFSTHGGFFGAELRWAGFDHIVLKGRSKKPVYLYIEDGAVTLRDAGRLTGLGTFATREAIRDELDDAEVQVLAIGPAGENLVRFACCHTDFGHGSHRGGMGAVMGAKNLKAVAVRGDLAMAQKKAEEALYGLLNLNRDIRSSPFVGMVEKGGSHAVFSAHEDRGLWRSSHFEDTAFDTKGAFAPEAVKALSLGSSACFACPVACRSLVRVPEGPRAGAVAEGPDFNHLAAFGPLLGCRNLAVAASAADLCVDLGLDPLETASLLSWTARLADLGVVSARDVSGGGVAFGQPDQLLDALGALARSEGAGAVLAEGGRSAASQFGRNAGDYLLQVKGMCLGPVDDRAAPAFGLASAVSSQGADHRAAPWADLLDIDGEELERIYAPYEGAISPDAGAYEGKARVVQWHENAVMAADSLGSCHLLAPLHDPDLVGYEEWAEQLPLSAGMALGPTQIWDGAERGLLMERLFNLREGMTGKADWLPDVVFTEQGGRKRKGRRQPLDRELFRGAVEEYYKLRGLDAKGKPEPAKLAALGLEKEPTYMM